MMQLKYLVAILFIGIGVALTYTVFETSVSLAIQFIWLDLLQTDTVRWVVVPLIFSLTFVYFYLQRTLDPSRGDSNQNGLGSMPAATFVNFAKILIVGFFSLLAGASLGPEAILVPSCMILGAYIGARVVSKDSHTVALMSGMGIVALFTAFFHSFIIGFLAILLVIKQTKSRLTIPLVVLGAVNAGVTYLILKLIDSKEAITMPAYSWEIGFSTILWSAALIAAGYMLIYLLSWLSKWFDKVYTYTYSKEWWLRASIAAAGLSLLYLLGGPLVQFTGNDSIVPLFEQAQTLGLLGIAWIILIKVAAIAWSKALGYKGGLIFPTIFLASALIACLQLYVSDFNLIYGFIAVMIGAVVANFKTGVLA